MKNMYTSRAHETDHYRCPLHLKHRTCPFQTCFLRLDELAYLLSCISHLHNPRNPVIDWVLGYCLIPHPYPLITQKQQTCPFQLCFLGLGEFAYLLPYILHYQVWVIASISSPPENTKHIHNGCVIWVWMNSVTPYIPHLHNPKTQSGMTFGLLPHPHLYSHLKTQSMSILDVFSAFG